jgi:hypothetical protein
VDVGHEWVDSSGDNNNAVPSASVTGVDGSHYTFDGQSYMYIKNLHFEVNLFTALEVEVEFRTTFNGSSNGFHNWAFIDFDRSEWFNCYLLATTHVAAFSSRGEDGVQDVIKGKTALNDGQWHTVKYSYSMSDALRILSSSSMAQPK